MSRKIATKGTKTTTGGQVLEGIPDITLGGQEAAVVGMQCSCKSGRKCCKGMGKIVAIGAPNPVFFDGGQQAALQGYQVMCGCPDNFICEPTHDVNTGIHGDFRIGRGVHLGNGVEFGKVPADPMTQYVPPAKRPRNRVFEQFLKDCQEAEAQIKAKEAAEAAAQASLTPTINPKNEYWPPYNFTKPEGEKQIEVLYRSPTTKVAIFTPEEWKRLFYLWDINGDVKTIKDTLTGLYNARETAKALGGLGVTAVVREVEGVEYLFLSNYDKFKQSILYGGVFRTTNPQVVKMGLAALDSVKGMTRYVKTNSQVEFLVGSGVNGLKFVVTDDYTLKELGVDEAKLLVNAVSVAIVSLGLAQGAAGIAALISAPVTVPVSLSILAISTFIVWALDKATDFEEKLVNAVVDEFDN